MDAGTDAALSWRFTARKSTGWHRGIRSGTVNHDDSTATPRRARTAGIIAAVSGLLGFVLLVLTPILPVDQTRATLDWPQGDSLGSVSAPLVAYAPQTLDLTIPCHAVDELPAEGGLLAATVPEHGHFAGTRGLLVRATASNVEIVGNDATIASQPRTAVSSGSCSAIVVKVDASGTTAQFVGLDEPQRQERRPSVVGVYSDLPTDANIPGLSLTADLDTRFTSSPSFIKYAAMGTGLLALVISLAALHRLDLTDGRRGNRILPRGWFRPRFIDAIVLGVLGIWHFIGANTADDGYLLTMARVADDAGYMANYYRWYGSPESPFGTPYYEILAAFTHVSVTSPWMRLPSLLAAILCWLLISREVIPRLGRGVRRNPVTTWTAAMVFLMFWMAFNNGLRPEPFVAVLSLLTWVCVERAIATGRLLPYAIAILIATLALTGNPTGLMAVAALLVGFRPMLRVFVRRARTVGRLPLIAPILASGTAVLVLVFGDQTLASVLESVRVRALIGPSEEWYKEIVRYYWLMIKTVDGGIARRFPVLAVLLCLFIVLFVLLRKRRIAGAARGPAWRLVGVMFGTMFFLMFSPTKWTHHFGVFTGIGAALAALAALAIWNTALRSARNRALFLGAVLLLSALSTSSIYGFWWVSSYGIPFRDRLPGLKGINVNSVLLVLALVALVVAGFLHLRQDYNRAPVPVEDARRRRIRTIASAPLAVVAAALVAFHLLAFAKAAYSQYPAYSVAKGNIGAVTGDECALASNVLVEPDPNGGLLSPHIPPSLAGRVDPKLGPLAGTGETKGFTPDGILPRVHAEPLWYDAGVANKVVEVEKQGEAAAGEDPGTAGGTNPHAGINGSTARLPFGLDSKRVPVLGSFNAPGSAKLVSAWYTMAERTEDRPLVSFAAAGRIKHYDEAGKLEWGQEVLLEYGRVGADGELVPGGPSGVLEPADPGPKPSWRNLRFPVADIPPEANVVRIIVNDESLAGEQWVAVTPPRMSRMETLNEYVGSEDPVLLDWAVALQFPCQRPLAHKNGVAEVAKWRITPDRGLTNSGTDTWQAYENGGILGYTEMATWAETVPTYLRDAWRIDWGSLHRLTPHRTATSESVRPAVIETRTELRSGLWKPAAPIQAEGK